MKRLLIVKMGYTETLASFLNLGVSLGDVLRTTFILNYFKDWDVTWIVDEKAFPLLDENPFIKRTIIWSESRAVKEKLGSEEFDLVINFENLSEICEFVSSLKGRKFMGFSINGLPESVGSQRLIEISINPEKKRRNMLSWQQILADAIGKKWKGERYILGYRPKSSVCYDIGFNWTTSNKWKNKAWPEEKWLKLEKLLNKKYTISWQRGMNNLYEYIEWINSCKLIVTADTLGLHLALALNKRVVALFGPTSPYEVYLYELGSYLLPGEKYDCMPCFRTYCEKGKPCIELITPEEVKEVVESEIKKT